MRRIAANLMLTFLIATSLSVSLDAETCVIRPDLSVPRVCGHITYLNGDSVANVRLQLVNNLNEIVASAQTGSVGEFNFDTVQKGDYHLVIASSAKWAGVRWRVKVTKSYKSSDSSGDGSVDFLSPVDHIHPSPFGVKFISRQIADYIYQHHLVQ